MVTIVSTLVGVLTTWGFAYWLNRPGFVGGSFA
jgi:hypothetical protein